MKVSRPLGIIALLLCATSIINGLLPQIQLAIFNGRMPFLMIYLKFMLLGVLLFAAFSKKLNFSKNIAFWWGLFVLYLIADLIFTNLIRGVGAFDIFFGYNAMYFWLLLIPFADVVRVKISSARIESFVIAISIPIIILGYAQLVTNHAILQTKSLDRRFEVLVYLYYGFVRPFSVFSAPAYYATFVAFVGLLAFSKLLSSKSLLGRIMLFVYFIFVAIAEYTSYGRAEILAFSLGLLFIFWWKMMGLKAYKYVALLWISLVSSILVIILGVAREFLKDGALFHNQSLIERLGHWVYWIDEMYHHSDSLLFGTGIFQNGQISKYGNVVVDNMLIAIALQIGIIGLFISIGYIWSVWRFVARRCAASHADIDRAQLAFLGLWPVFAIFGTGLNIFPVYAFLAILTSQYGATQYNQQLLTKKHIVHGYRATS